MSSSAVSLRTHGVLAVTVAALLWGTTGTAATFAPAVGPLAIGAAAMGLGGVLQAAIAAGAIRRHAGALRAHAGIVVLGAAAVAIYPLAFYTSMRIGGVAVGTVVSLASAPLASAVIERVVDGVRLTTRWSIAAGLGVAGAAALCVARAVGDRHEAAATVASVVLGLIAGITYALYTWAAHRLMQRKVARSAAMGTVFGLGGLALVPLIFVFGAPIIESGRSFAVAAYMVLVPMFLGYVLFGIGIARVRASTATTLTLVEPAVAALLAVAVLGERLSPAGWAGLAAIGLSLVVVAYPATPASGTHGRWRPDRVRT